MDPQSNQGQNSGGQPTPPPVNPAGHLSPQGGNPQGAQPGAGLPPQGGQQVPPGAYPPGYYPPYPPQGYPQGAYPQDPAMYPPPGAYPPGYPPYPPQGYPQGGYPQGAYPQPPMPQGGAYPPAGGMGQPGAAMPPVQPEDTTPANFQIGAKLPGKLTVKVPPHSLNFEEDYFIRLLAGSISLSKDEKKRIIESVPKLKQAQIDELIRIFEEEKQKFAALSKKHVPQLEKLAEQHFREWMDLETEFVNDSKKKEDQNKAEEIRKSLGI